MTILLHKPVEKVIFEEGRTKGVRRKHGEVPLALTIDLMPEKSAEEIAAESWRLLEEQPKKAVKNVLKGFLPERLIPLLLSRHRGGDHFEPHAQTRLGCPGKRDQILPLDGHGNLVPGRSVYHRRRGGSGYVAGTNSARLAREIG